MEEGGWKNLFLAKAVVVCNFEHDINVVPNEYLDIMKEKGLCVFLVTLLLDTDGVTWSYPVS